MHNKPVERTQADGQQFDYSQLTAIDFTNARDMTRQEGAADADINVIMKRHGVQVRQPVYGEANFEQDLQQSLAAIDHAEAMMRRLPANLREKYPTWQTLLNAVNSGQLRIDLRTEEKKQEPKTVPTEEKTPPKEG